MVGIPFIIEMMSDGMFTESVAADKLEFIDWFDTRRNKCLDRSDILSENVSINDDGLTNTIAIISVLGRAAGDILQDTRTVSHKTRTMTVDIVMLPPTGCFLTANSTANILAQSPYYDVRQIFLAMQTYLQSIYSQVYVVQNTDSWSNDLSSYSRTVGWKYANCSPSGLSNLL
jgi:hypothetical protein